jgi:hypothetical protein
MRLGIAFAAAGIALLCCWLTGNTPGVIVCVLVLAYLGSLVAAPMWRCRSCHGSGEHDDPFGLGGSRACWTCHGKKKYPRIGVRLLRPQVHARIKAGEHGRNY